MTFKLLTTTVLIIALLYNCEESVDPPVETEPYPDLGLTQEDSLEAEIVAYYLDQTLTASDSTFRRELYLLNFLRQAYGDSLPFVDNLRFFPPWQINTLLVGAEDSILTQMRTNSFQNWGSIPLEMRPDSVGRTIGSTLAEFFLNPGYHPVLLSEFYEVLPVIRYAEASVWLYTYQPYYPLAINRSDSSNTYLFTLFSPPYTYTYHLFNYVDQQPNYLGTFPEIPTSEYFEFLNNFHDIGFP